MSDPFPIGSRLTIAGRGAPYEVREAVAVEGGLWRLSLRPTEPPFDMIEVEVFQHRSGAWLTEDLEELTPDGAAPPSAEMPAGYQPCKSCGAPLRWSWTKNGKRTPTNPDGTSHYGTCPQAEEWRRKAREKVEVKEPGPAEPETPASAGQMTLF